MTLLSYFKSILIDLSIGLGLYVANRFYHRQFFLNENLIISLHINKTFKKLFLFLHFFNAAIN